MVDPAILVPLIVGGVVTIVGAIGGAVVLVINAQTKSKVEILSMTRQIAVSVDGSATRATEALADANRQIADLRLQMAGLAKVAAVLAESTARDNAPAARRTHG